MVLFVYYMVKQNDCNYAMNKNSIWYFIVLYYTRIYVYHKAYNGHPQMHNRNFLSADTDNGIFSVVNQC